MQVLNVLVAAHDANMLDRICSSIASDGALHLAGRCNAGDEAVRLTQQLQPDVVALDMRLADIDNLMLVAELLKTGTTVVAMNSATGIALQALDAGAADFVYIPEEGSDSDHTNFVSDAIDRIKMASANRNASTNTHAKLHGPVKLIVVVSAKGGPVLLASLLKRLPKGGPAVLIAQWRPELFSENFIGSLANLSGREILQASDAMELTEGCIAIVDGESPLRVEESGNTLVLRLGGFGCNCNHPADMLFTSVASALGDGAIGLLLSDGDGITGLKHMAASGSLAIQQNKNALLREINYKVLDGILEMPLEDMAGEILRRISSLI